MPLKNSAAPGVTPSSGAFIRSGKSALSYGSHDRRLQAKMSAANVVPVSTG